MKVTLKFLRDNSTKELYLDDFSTVSSLFEKLNRDPDTAVILRNGLPIPLDTMLQDDDRLTLLIVTSGG